MGAWGTAIFSDDIAADVRDEFTDLIAEGLSATAATKELLSRYEDALDDPDDGVVFWLALAAIQHKLGRLTARVRKKAIRIIDTDADISRWSDCPRSEIRQRKKNLAKLRRQMTAAQPKPTKLRRRTKSSTDFRTGDIVSFQFTPETGVRFCVLQTSSDLGGTYAHICLLGLEDGRPFRKKRLRLADTLGPHYTLVSHEPDVGITILRRGVALPDRVPETFRAWVQIRINGHVCRWHEFPDALCGILPKLGWKSAR